MVDINEIQTKIMFVYARLALTKRNKLVAIYYHLCLPEDISAAGIRE
jgi:hypothetical protein